MISSDLMTNKEISQLFRQVAASYVIKDQKKFLFQILAYQKAADVIDGLTPQLQDIYKEGRLEEVQGIGKTLRERLTELFETGRVKHFEEVIGDIPPAVFVLMKIPSFGPKKAFKLADHFKLKPETALEELKKAGLEGKIAPLPSFGEKSEKDILRAIEEYGKGYGKTTKMLLPFAGEIAEDLLAYLKSSKVIERAETLGSMRRMKALVGDIDMAVASTKPEEAIAHFVAYPKKDRIIEQGPASASMLVSGGHQVDLMVQPPDQFGSLIQHFTGSKDHNVHLRELAQKKGLSLSERGIKIVETDEMLKFKDEEKFYQYLGMQWVPPEMREDTGEVQLALKNNLPKIIELKDIRGDFHIHSSFPLEPSHDLGRNTIEEMLAKAKSLGYEYLGFSEHNPAISKNTKSEIIEHVRERNEEIERLRDMQPVKIFRMMETDILPNGSLALPDEALDILDASIVSIHSVFNTPKEEMTKRVLSGLSHPKAKILAHPTGRLLNKRNGYELDFEKIFEFCVKNNKALEINGYPNRLDLSDPVIKLAIEAGVKLTIDTDSHASYQMELMKYGVAIARRGWAKKSDIINCMSYNEVANWFKS
jgi:DNA polymerase (family X)